MERVCENGAAQREDGVGYVSSGRGTLPLWEDVRLVC